MNLKNRARLLRRKQTLEEKQLWLALRAGRFAGFKFRRQHPLGKYCLDFYCPLAKLCIELDGFQHGLPGNRTKDEARTKFLNSQGVLDLRFWNHVWQKNREGVLLEIWNALHARTGCMTLKRKIGNNRYNPPNPKKVIEAPLPIPLPAIK